jgi:hypothetical protein
MGKQSRVIKDFRYVGLLFVIIIGLTTIIGCFGEEDEGDGGAIYSCTYDKRSTGCGGTGWSDWETSCYEFDIDDYVEGWTPEMVCDKFSGSGEECGGSCCILYEYRDNVLSSGYCPDEYMVEE